eukprot:50206-Eustigmatos_ZCMA.PRE.1
MIVAARYIPSGRELLFNYRSSRMIDKFRGTMRRQPSDLRLNDELLDVLRRRAVGYDSRSGLPLWGLTHPALSRSYGPPLPAAP